MNQTQSEHRSDFVQFLRQGLHRQIIPGEFTYDQILQKFNITQPREPLVRGFTYTWFQDLFSGLTTTEFWPL